MTGHNDKDSSRIQDLIDLRRKAVIDLMSQGITSVRDIASRLNVSKSLIHTDIKYLRSQAEHSINEYVTTTLPVEMELSLTRLNNMIRRLHEDIENSNNSIRDKHSAISLINQCTQLRLDIIGAGVLANQLNQQDNIKKEHKNETNTVS